MTHHTPRTTRPAPLTLQCAPHAPPPTSHHDLPRHTPPLTHHTPHIAHRTAAKSLANSLRHSSTKPLWRASWKNDRVRYQRKLTEFFCVSALGVCSSPSEGPQSRAVHRQHSKYTVGPQTMSQLWSTVLSSGCCARVSFWWKTVQRDLLRFLGTTARPQSTMQAAPSRGFQTKKCTAEQQDFETRGLATAYSAPTSHGYDTAAGERFVVRIENVGDVHEPADVGKHNGRHLMPPPP